MARLAELRRTLRERVLTSPLADLPAFVRDLEEVYLAMWNQTLG